MKKFINLDDIPDYDAPARNIQPSAKPTRSGSGEGNRIVVRQVKPVPKSYMEMYIKEDAPARAEAKSREDGLKVIQNVAKGPMRKPVEDDRYENISEQQTSVSPRGGPSPRSPRSPRSHNALKRNQVVSPPPSDDEYSLRDSIDQLPHYAHALNRNGPVNASPPAPPMRAMPQKKPSPKKQVANGSPVHYKYRDYEDTNDDDDNDSYGDVYASPTTAVVPKHQEKKAPMPVAKAAAPLAQNNRLQRYASPVVTQSSKPKPMPVAKVSPPPAAPAVKEHPIESAEDMLCYSKQPRPVVYKYVHPTNGLSSIMFLVDRPYTLNQYRNIRANEYVEIPKLKPDLNTDELKAKRANLNRIKEFGKNLQNVNKMMIGEQKRLPPSTECDSIQKSKHAHESNRQKALEFAKHIPKPKVVVKPLAEKPNEGRDFPRLRDSLDELGGTTHLLEEDSDGFDDTYYVQSNNVYDDNFETAAKISALEAKRMDARKQVEAIKKSLGLAK